MHSIVKPAQEASSLIAGSLALPTSLRKGIHAVMVDFTLNELQYLVAVADHGSFRGAADALFVTSPAISSALDNLELFLGAELLERTERGFRRAELTTVGGDVYKQARLILECCKEIEAAVTPKKPIFKYLRNACPKSR